MNDPLKIKEALSYDPLREAEKITGRSYKGDDSVTMLGMLLNMSKAQEIDGLMTLTRDTKFMNKVTDFIEIIESMGFRQIYYNLIILLCYKDTY